MNINTTSYFATRQIDCQQLPKEHKGRKGNNGITKLLWEEAKLLLGLKMSMEKSLKIMRKEFRREEKRLDSILKVIFKSWKPNDPIPAKLGLHMSQEDLAILRPNVKELSFNFLQSTELKNAFRGFFPKLRKGLLPADFDPRSYYNLFTAAPTFELYVEILQYLSSSKELTFHLVQLMSDPAIPDTKKRYCLNKLEPRFNDIANFVVRSLFESRQEDVKIPRFLNPLMFAIRLRVTSLDLSDLKGNDVTGEELLDLWDFFPNLCEINLERMDTQGEDITDAAVKEIARRYPNLERLNLAGCPEVMTDDSIGEIARRCPHLKALDLRVLDEDFVLADNWGVGLQAIAENCHHLESLKLEYVDEFTAHVVQRLVEHNPNLKNLYLETCPLTHEMVQTIVTGCHSLESITLDCCEIGQGEYRFIAENCPHLKKLNVRSNEPFTPATFRMIGQGCPDLETLKVDYDHVHEDVAFLQSLDSFINLRHLVLSIPPHPAVSIDYIYLEIPVHCRKIGTIEFKADSPSRNARVEFEKRYPNIKTICEFNY